MKNIFESASKKALRFTTGRGQITTEDLWGMSLESLDIIAIQTNKLFKDVSDESFIKKKNPANTTLALKMEILKHIIKEKLTAKTNAKDKAIIEAQLATMQSIDVEASMEELKKLTPEERAAKIAELTAQL